MTTFAHKFGPDLSSDDEIWADQLPPATAQVLREEQSQMITITRKEYESLKRQIAELSTTKEIK